MDNILINVSERINMEGEAEEEEDGVHTDYIHAFAQQDHLGSLLFILLYLALVREEKEEK